MKEKTKDIWFPSMKQNQYMHSNFFFLKQKKIALPSCMYAWQLDMLDMQDMYNPVDFPHNSV